MLYSCKYEHIFMPTCVYVLALLLCLSYSFYNLRQQVTIYTRFPIFLFSLGQKFSYVCDRIIYGEIYKRKNCSDNRSSGYFIIKESSHIWICISSLKKTHSHCATRNQGLDMRLCVLLTTTNLLRIEEYAQQQNRFSR